MNLVEATGIRRSFGPVRAVDGVDLVVRPGEAYGLVGPDGAGKTTTLRLLVGALRPDAGSVAVAGIDLARHPDAARASIGYLAQRFSLYGDLTVLENLAFFAQVRGVATARFGARAEELLGFVGLQGFEDRRADQLSGGMKQKLGLACALVHDPTVLLLDEPTGGVDPVTRQEFWKLLIRLLAEGRAIVVSTPYMDEAARCTRVGFLRAGRILVEGSPRSIAARMQGRVLELAARPPRLAGTLAAADPDVLEVVAFGDRLHLHVASAAGPLERLPAALASGGAIVDRLGPTAPTLEDAFIALLADHRAGAGEAGPPERATASPEREAGADA